MSRGLLDASIREFCRDGRGVYRLFCAFRPGCLHVGALGMITRCYSHVTCGMRGLRFVEVEEGDLAVQ